MDTIRISELTETENPLESDVLIIEGDNSTKKVTKQNLVKNKQDVLVSGTNIKTIGGQSLLGSGNIQVSVDVDQTYDSTSSNAQSGVAVKQAIDTIDLSGYASKTSVNNIINGTQVVGKASQDANGNNIALTYATQSSLDVTNNMVSLVETDISNIKDGTQIVGKASEDASGNVITSTYATKSSLNSYMTKGVTEVTLTTSWTSSGDFFTQSVSVSGMTSSDTPFLSLKTLQYTSLEDIENAETEFAKIVDFDTRSGSILIRAKEETTQNLILIVKGK